MTLKNGVAQRNHKKFKHPGYLPCSNFELYHNTTTAYILEPLLACSNVSLKYMHRRDVIDGQDLHGPLVRERERERESVRTVVFILVPRGTCPS